MSHYNLPDVVGLIDESFTVSRRLLQASVRFPRARTESLTAAAGTGSPTNLALYVAHSSRIHRPVVYSGCFM
jgi:hypothetical protein